METSIREVTAVDLELEIQGTPEDLSLQIDEALRTYRRQVTMKGFRPGKVPLSLVKKMYGKAVSFDVVDKLVQSTYESEVLEAETYKGRVLGRPTVTKLEYEPFGPLHAVVQFGIRPDVILADLSGEEITKLVHPVTDEDVEHEIENIRDKHAEMRPKEEGVIEETDYAILDFQQLDQETGTPIEGETHENVSVFLGDPNVYDALKTAILGKKIDDVLTVELPHESNEDPETEDPESTDEPQEPKTRTYQVTIQDIKIRFVPELDDDFVQEVTEDRLDSVEAFKSDLRAELEQRWETTSREKLEDKITQRMLDLHPIPIPQAVVEMYQDFFVDDVKQQNKGALPDNFDETAFRTETWTRAEELARWSFIRDAFMEQESIELTDEDINRHFDEMIRKPEAEEEGAQIDENQDEAADEIIMDTSDESEAEPEEVVPEVTGAAMRSFFEQYGMMDRLERRLLDQMVFDALVSKFTVVEKSRADFEQEEENAEAAAE
jgi:trigger factor